MTSKAKAAATMGVVEKMCICGSVGSKTCGRCRLRKYCSVECQKKDWPAHKRTCGTNATVSPAQDPRPTYGYATRPSTQKKDWPAHKRTCGTNATVSPAQDPRPTYGDATRPSTQKQQQHQQQTKASTKQQQHRSGSSSDDDVKEMRFEEMKARGRVALKAWRDKNKNKQKESSNHDTVEKVHKLLRDAGVEGDLDCVSNCLKRAILKGYIKIDGPNSLDQIVIESKCFICDGKRHPTIAVTVRQLLHQSDYAGTDYEDGGEDASIRCAKCKNGIYVTRICEGNPQFDSGKFHNHCNICPDFGMCIGDYREAHCDTCGKHYFTGLSGFPCPNCHPSSGDDDHKGYYYDDDSDYDSDDDDDGDDRYYYSVCGRKGEAEVTNPKFDAIRYLLGGYDEATMTPELRALGDQLRQAASSSYNASLNAPSSSNNNDNKKKNNNKGRKS